MAAGFSLAFTLAALIDLIPSSRLDFTASDAVAAVAGLWLACVSLCYLARRAGVFLGGEDRSRRSAAAPATPPPQSRSGPQ